MKWKGLLVWLVLAIPFFAVGQGLRLFQKPNSLKENQKHGRWFTYHDAEEEIVQSRGRYKNGNPVGIWKYFDEEGNLAQRDVHRKLKIRTKKYYPNGKVKNKGEGIIEITEDQLEYFYQGVWKYYHDTGKLHKTVRYERGQDIEEVIISEPGK